jgi:hypothetical protein
MPRLTSVREHHHRTLAAGLLLLMISQTHTSSLTALLQCPVSCTRSHGFTAMQWSTVRLLTNASYPIICMWLNAEIRFVFADVPVCLVHMETAGEMFGRFLRLLAGNVLFLHASIAVVFVVSFQSSMCYK